MPQIIWDIPKADVEGIVAWRPKTKPDVQVSTWYRINGDLQHGLTPILVVHGGPGECILAPRREVVWMVEMC